MKKQDYSKIARSIRSDIRAHFECLGIGIAQDEYLKLRAKSDQATHLAKYLGEYLVLPPEDRSMFLELCGFRALALGVTK